MAKVSQIRPLGVVSARWSYQVWGLNDWKRLVWKLIINAGWTRNIEPCRSWNWRRLKTMALCLVPFR